MGVFLGQLPPAELARMKAELAETLIAHFCYPRFFDYRTESLHSRPVDRSKRQEVWLFLSSFDFTAWNRVDLMSPDFQHHVERLFIHFVQRNRSFFGEQGRKRLADIRMLIGTSALSVVQGMRGHLMGQHRNNPPFGSPRPVASWSTTNTLGASEPTWEQISSSTMLIQQQLQEVRGVIKPVSPAPQSEARPATATARRTGANAASAAYQAINGKATNGAEHRVAAVSNVPTGPINRIPPQSNLRSPSPLPEPKSPTPLHSARQTTAPASPPKAEAVVSPVEPPILSVASAAVPVKSPNVSARPMPPQESIPPTPALSTPVQTQSRGLPQPVPATPATISTTQRESATILVSEEDMAIFEQLRHQLIVWLRVEAVRSGLEIANHGPSHLIELLRQQDNCNETHLQVVSSLLNLSNQVFKNGQASHFDYKQALMFHLMHTRR
jgi:hypothetical protein